MAVAELEERFLTRGELADRWRVHYRSIPDLVKKRVVAGIKFGRIVRFPLSGIIEAERAGLTRDITETPKAAHRE